MKSKQNLRRAFLALINVAILLCCQYGIGNHYVAAGGLGDVNIYTAVTTAYARQSNSVVYHPASGKIYASIPSSRDSKGNSIARIDPLTGTVEQTYWIGSEPNKMALAVDGNTIYVSIDGALSLRKFDASTNTPRGQFSAGIASFYGPMIPRDFALSPVNANVVAVARDSIPDSVAVFDNGVQRTNVGGIRPLISFTNTESTLFGIGSSFMEKMSVDETGVTAATLLNWSPGGNTIASTGNRMFTNHGDVFDAQSGAQIATLPLTNYFGLPKFVIDGASHTIFFVGNTSNRFRITAFDTTTLQLIGYADSDCLPDDVKSVARWGTNGLALSIRNLPTRFIQSDLVGPGAILPPADPPEPETIIEPYAYIRQLTIAHNDLIFNPRDKLLYASIPFNVASPPASSITRIDPESGNIVSSAFIGGDPHKIALSNDGETLYASLHDTAMIRRFDTVTQTAGFQFPMPNRFQPPVGFAILPGSPGSVAVASQNEGLWVFDNGVPRPQLVTSSMGEVVNGQTPNVLYAVSAGYPYRLFKLNVTPAGLNVVTDMWQEASGMVYTGGKVYGAHGRVIDPDTNLVQGSFSESFGNVIAVDSTAGRAFIAQSRRVDVFDTHTYNKIGTIPLPYGENATAPKAIVRWGYNGLAISSRTTTGGSWITLVQSPLVAPPRPFDFDGDGKTDIGIFRPAESGGEWWINQSSSGATFAMQFGASTDKIVPADYTGDGKADITLWRPSTGEWYVLRSEDNSFFAFPFGAEGDIPAPADYDADGKADSAVFRPSSATWFISPSGGGETRIFQFGVTGDSPVVADYDGDGKADVGIFRQAAGGAEWWIDRSTAGLLAMQFGASTDKAVQGDYTGDGKTDIAIWRPSTGEWFVVRSEDFSFYGFPFGTTDDVVAPGDYDGDGKFDVALFRPSSATWFISRTTAGTQIVQFGATGDRPLPNAFIP